MSVSTLPSISEIDAKIDASFKSKVGTDAERLAYRNELRTQKAEVIAALDKRPKLKTAEEIIASISAPRKKFRKAKFEDERVVVCGATNWTDKSRIRFVLKHLTPKNVRCIITGTSKGAEQLVISVAKELKLPVIQVHPQQHLGGSAIHIRNNDVFKLLKPTRVIAFHDDIDESVSSALYLKLGTRADIPSILITKKETTSSISKKMKVSDE